MINRIGLQYSSPLPEPLPACYQIKNDDKKGELCLLCLTPLIDATTSDAMSQIRTISIALKGLALTLKHISFTAADNTSVNPCIARKIKKPMIRCKSHVIALSIKEFLNGHKGKWFKLRNHIYIWLIEFIIFVWNLEAQTFAECFETKDSKDYKPQMDCYLRYD